MTVTIDVPTQVATEFSAEAARQGKGAPDVVRGLVERRFTPRAYAPEATLALLASVDEGDADEPRETLDYLKVAVDRDRPGQRGIFGEGINPVSSLQRARG